MSNNTIIIILATSLVILIGFYLLYTRASIKKQEKMQRVHNDKMKSLENEKKYHDNTKIKEPILDKELVKKRIIIKENKKNTSNQKDIISEAISELNDLDLTKNQILKGQRNLTNLFSVEMDNTPFNILVADDSNVSLKKAKQSLTNSGENYAISTAVNGEEALYMLKKGNYDLLITDMDMPKMDGAELILQVKQNLVLSKIPIIVVTAQPKLITNGLEDKVEGVLEKPYNDEDLIYQAKNALM